MFLIIKFNGVMVIILEGNILNDDDIILVCRFVVRYSKGKDEDLVEVKYG